MREQRLEGERANEAAEKEKATRQELAWWLGKYPNPAAIERERKARLQQTRRSLAINAARIATLEQERRALVDLCEYCDPGKPMPHPQFRRAFDENRAMLEAQRQIASNGLDELKRVDEQYAWTLARMKELWKKAPIESLRASTP